MGKILTKNSRTPTIDDPLHRLLIVFYDGERDSRYSFFVCCSPQQSVNQHDGRVVRKRGTRAFAMCVRHERPKVGRAGASQPVPNDDHRHPGQNSQRSPELRFR